jgi:purine-nucleoside phosphorylase
MTKPEFSSIPAVLENSGARTAIVLGSGLASFVDSVETVEVIPYEKIPGLPTSAVPGHRGRFIVGGLDDCPLLIAQGRIHLYEGWSAAEVASHVRLMHAIGIQRLILTNAAGSLRSDFNPGDWMLLADHLNLTGASPLHGGPHFVDLSEVYSTRLRATFKVAARDLQVALHEGVYASVHGPQYETPAEVRMLRAMGADAVGMSTALEAIQARALGLEVAALSCLTNWAAGLSATVLNHDEVLETGRSASDTLAHLLRRALPKFAPIDPNPRR